MRTGSVIVFWTVLRAGPPFASYRGEHCGHRNMFAGYQVTHLLHICHQARLQFLEEPGVTLGIVWRETDTLAFGVSHVCPPLDPPGYVLTTRGRLGRGEKI